MNPKLKTSYDISIQLLNAKKSISLIEKLKILNNGQIVQVFDQFNKLPAHGDEKMKGPNYNVLNMY